MWRGLSFGKFRLLLFGGWGEPVKWHHSILIAALLIWQIGTIYAQIVSAIALDRAAFAVSQASEDFRDDRIQRQAADERIGVALGQLERDMIRFRQYLRKHDKK